MSHYRPWMPAPIPPTPNPGLAPGLAVLSPALAFRQMTGLGEVSSRRIGEVEIGTGVGLVLLGLTGAFSYFAGSEMAPSGSNTRSWGIVAIPVGLLTGALGLGIMGFVAAKK